jgi:hypothetical protein
MEGKREEKRQQWLVFLSSLHPQLFKEFLV